MLEPCNAEYWSPWCGLVTDEMTGLRISRPSQTLIPLEFCTICPHPLEHNSNHKNLLAGYLFAISAAGPLQDTAMAIRDNMKDARESYHGHAGNDILTDNLSSVSGFSGTGKR